MPLKWKMWPKECHLSGNNRARATEKKLNKIEQAKINQINKGKP